jgi:hypothetical protein
MFENVFKIKSCGEHVEEKKNERKGARVRERSHRDVRCRYAMLFVMTFQKKKDEWKKKIFVHCKLLRARSEETREREVSNVYKYM